MDEIWLGWNLVVPHTNLGRYYLLLKWYPTNMVFLSVINPNTKVLCSKLHARLTLQINSMQKHWRGESSQKTLWTLRRGVNMCKIHFNVSNYTMQKHWRGESSQGTNLTLRPNRRGGTNICKIPFVENLKKTPMLRILQIFHVENPKNHQCWEPYKFSMLRTLKNHQCWEPYKFPMLRTLKNHQC